MSLWQLALTCDFLVKLSLVHIHETNLFLISKIVLKLHKKVAMICGMIQILHLNLCST